MEVSCVADISRLPSTPGDLDYLLAKKDEFMTLHKIILETDATASSLCEEFSGWTPWTIRMNYGNNNNDRTTQAERYFDRICWQYLVSRVRIEKYMLSTEYEKLSKDIDEFRTPSFTRENVTGWMRGLEVQIYDNVARLVKTVYKEICEGVYYTTPNYRQKKKRNNNGIDKFFILRTADFFRIGSGRSSATVTDDLEKVCYILSGTALPEETAIMKMQRASTYTYSGPFFALKLCQNGNTHYTLTEDIKNKLNFFGPEGRVIGENIRIKIFEGR